jgi:mRNA-degrading endonuclease RelE of RelBE toxin-antitoxin system
MSFACVFHPAIQTDYNEAYEWYESQKEGLGERFLIAVRRKIEEIIEHPEHYGARTRKDYREAQVDIFPYNIVYKVYKQRKTILVVSIHHTKKHPRKRYRK